ncbi:MAG: VOC family protein [Gammaproteobacteria bacterium]
MTQSKLQKIVPHLWYNREAVEATRFYTSIFPDSRVDRVTALPVDSPSGPAGSVDIVEFTLFGQAFMAMSAGPHHDFNDAISLIVNCDTQAELDRYWDAILKHGGKPQACGWIIDKYGVRWQITPTVMGDMMADPDSAKARRVAQAMMKQVKFDIAALEAAFNGR